MAKSPRSANPSARPGRKTKNSPPSRRGSPSRTRRSFGQFRWLQFRGAIWAELVRLRDFFSAIRTGGVQIALTVRTEVEARADGFAAPRAGIRQRFAHEQVDNQADDADG